MIDDKVTVLIPTSPIPSHPRTAIIEETIASVRYHLPHSYIYILADGVRDEQKDQMYFYDKHITRLDRLGTPKLLVLPHEEHLHQVGMMRLAMDCLDTPYLLFVEHDCPLVQRPIRWDAIATELDAGTVNFVRFLPEPQIHPEHEHLMLDEIATSQIRLRQTIQFSARPHIATKAFYEKLLARYSPEAKCFIEDVAHSWCQSEPWNEWRMAVYLDPEGKDSKFSYHLDGRAQARKYDELQTF